MTNPFAQLFETYPVLRQLLRFGMIGIATNAVGYASYVLLTTLGLAPKWAMSILYLVGATLSYIGNKKITFAYEGENVSSVTRCIIAHVAGYGINLLLQITFVDHLGYDHRIVQLAAMGVVALFLFIMFRTFVFSNRDKTSKDLP